MARPEEAAGVTTAARRPPGKRHRVTRSPRTRGKRFEPLLLLGLGCGFVAGFAIGQAPHRLIGGALELPWVAAATSGTHLAGIAAGWWATRVIARRRLDSLETGGEANTCARQAIEHPLTTRGCTVAHSVGSIARTGTIDHLVATPLRLCVIETEHEDVPRDHFPGVLRQVAEHTSAVWKWAPPGTPVRGCLVLAKGSMARRRSCDYGTGPVVVHTPTSLARELGAEAGKERVIDGRVAPDVWKLGRLAE